MRIVGGNVQITGRRGTDPNGGACAFQHGGTDLARAQLGPGTLQGAFVKGLGRLGDAVHGRGVIQIHGFGNAGHFELEGFRCFTGQSPFTEKEELVHGESIGMGRVIQFFRGCVETGLSVPLGGGLVMGFAHLHVFEVEGRFEGLQFFEFGRFGRGVVLDHALQIGGVDLCAQIGKFFLVVNAEIGLYFPNGSLCDEGIGEFVFHEGLCQGREGVFGREGIQARLADDPGQARQDGTDSVGIKPTTGYQAKAQSCRDGNGSKTGDFEKGR